MKQTLIRLTAASLTLGFALSLAACDSGAESSAATEPAAASTAAQTTADTAAQTTAAAATGATGAAADRETDLHRLHAPVKDGDPFAGSWRITGGTGSQLKNFVFSFDGNKNDCLIVGTTGYCGTYQLEEKDGKDVFSTHLMFGLDGDYTYEFSEDKQSVVLTALEDKSTTTMQKDGTYSCVPAPVKDPVTDEALLGAWKDDTGEYLYFGRDGVMYKTQIHITFTYYTYAAKDGVIKASYSTNKEQEETFTYRVDGDKLRFNDYEYKRIPASELV